MKTINNYIVEKFKIKKGIITEPGIELKRSDFIKDLADLLSKVTKYQTKVRKSREDPERQIDIFFKKDDFTTNSQIFFNEERKIEIEIQNNLDNLKLKSCKCTGDGIRRKIYVYPEYK